MFKMRSLSTLLLVAIAHASESIRSPVDSRDVGIPTTFTTKRETTTEPCANIASAWAIAKPKMNGNINVPAKAAYDCLMSVPVDVQGDLKMIDEMKLFLQFQSDLSYLKDGIKTHNAEPLDLLAGLDEISQSVRSGLETSEYNVQQRLSSLLRKAGDFHLQWNADIQTPFTFIRRSSELVSYSTDGLALPQIYLYDDILPALQSGREPVASPLKTINGKDAFEYLDNIASSYATFHDQDARYNTLFVNLATKSTGNGQFGPFVQPPVYDGPVTNITFQNGSTISLENIAQIAPSFSFANVTDGKSFFRQFCTGSLSTVPYASSRDLVRSSSAAAIVAAAPAPAAVSDVTKTSAANHQFAAARQAASSSIPKLQPTGYPEPVIVQSQLALQGYFLNDTGYEDVAVLAMPDFGPNINNLYTTEPNVYQEVQNMLDVFLQVAVRDKKKKLIIDLRGNTGGKISLAYVFFKQLFPTLEAYGATRMRAHQALAVFSAAVADLTLNGTHTNISLAQQKALLKSYGPLDFLNIMDENGTKFTDFKDYYGPYANNKDEFTGLRRYDFSDLQNGYWGAGDFNLTGYGNQAPAPTKNPFEAENMVVMTDGSCGSTCAIFAQFMREQGKVQFIGVGGRPKKAPMQPVGGSKGAQVLGWNGIQGHMRNVLNDTKNVYGERVAQLVNLTAVGDIAAVKQLAIRASHTNTDETLGGRVNSLDNIRKGDKEGIPLEFVYEAADCKLFYTLESLRSPVALWKTAVDAKWGSGSCVEGSTGDKSSVGVENNTPFNKNKKQKPRSFREILGRSL
ncbi:hypothetical protein K504DRAFT_429018 [Pleomassaria siparia CBS 279.74]|uniref:Uncharacterized protein n=1 Tax=Pleomassaria siparia CBS 279.74 TaxID=1314801 RepID=A0A6G1KEG4_9PLEO|nr:hypothetical protein K504DRAFT_429018 [Pleomassaria siparia CBS 279.74]